jgi:hypothetical protein
MLGNDIEFFKKETKTDFTEKMIWKKWKIVLWTAGELVSWYSSQEKKSQMLHWDRHVPVWLKQCDKGTKEEYMKEESCGWGV